MIKLLPPYRDHDEISHLTRFYLTSVLRCETVEDIEIQEINEFLLLQEFRGKEG